MNEAEEIRMGDTALVCGACGFNRFHRGRALLNTAGMTVLGLDWANREARLFICDRCGHIEWFYP